MYIIWLCQVFVAARAALSLWCSGTSLYWFLLLRSTGSRAQELQQLQFLGSTVVVPRLSFSAACGICPDQGSNLGLLHWQADSLPLSHQGSPCFPFIFCRMIGLGEFLNVAHFEDWPTCQAVWLWTDMSADSSVKDQALIN